MANERSLEALGVEPDEESLYRAVLSDPDLSLVSAGRRAGLTAANAKRAAASLEEKGLVSRSPAKPGGVAAVPPDIAVEVLILRRQEEMERARIAMKELKESLSLDRSDPGDLVEVVSGHRAVGHRFTQLQQTAKREILGFDAPPYIGFTLDEPLTIEDNPAELAALKRGVRYRILYDSRGLEVPGRLETMRALGRQGEEMRVIEGLPIKLAIADAEVAMIPLSNQDPGAAVLVVHAPTILDALTLFFETLWARAVPFRPGAEGPKPTGRRNDDDLVTLLAAGFKDEAIARHLGIGLRTVERRIRGLMDELGARTRFQAGLMMSERHAHSS